MFFHLHLINFILCSICISCILIPTSESQYNDVINFTNGQQNEEKVFDFVAKKKKYTNYSKVNCGETQKMVHECFKNLPPHLMEFLQTTKIVVANKEEIVSKCTVFKHGVECFDHYTERCLPETKVLHFQNNVAGARKFVRKFCDDHKFQLEYLRNKECFFHIQNDWKRCTEYFHSILSDELNGSYSNNITSKYMQFCCARHAYETCIYNSARFKCFKNSTKFTPDTVKLFSEKKLFSNCRRYESLLCSEGWEAASAAVAVAATTGAVFATAHSLIFTLMFWIIVNFRGLKIHNNIV
ncbi:uncharacterized protein LOC129938421 [Eupeodes corollae]|uniref:uncharacterized protein LOC129938421 n=1 Tax=Eupeodes corollae TaxID=290404 RepID=UPI002491E193|nr:uncharacterized protein LOC129938421 [Eupeodes corollae]